MLLGKDEQVRVPLESTYVAAAAQFDDGNPDPMIRPFMGYRPRPRVIIPSTQVLSSPKRALTGVLPPLVRSSSANGSCQNAVEESENHTLIHFCRPGNTSRVPCWKAGV